MEQPEGPIVPHDAIAEGVKELRRSRGWSAEKLAEEMTRAGFAWSRVVVAKLETKRRPGVSVAELMGLAYVLGVPPVDLIVPTALADDAPFAVTPSAGSTAGDVRAWVGGLGFLQEPTTPAEFAEATRAMSRQRVRALNDAWLTPERAAEWNRATNKALEIEREQRWEEQHERPDQEDHPG